MQGSVHELIGVGSVSILAAYSFRHAGFTIGDQDIIVMLSVVTSAFGSLLPDIDMHSTTMGHRHRIISKAVNKVGGGHRGITHTLLVPALVFAFYYFVRTYLAGMPGLVTFIASLLFGFEAGYLLHIFADMFNGKGCPILWPLSSNKISFMDLPSSGKVPYVFAIVLLGLEIFLLFREEISHVLGYLTSLQ